MPKSRVDFWTKKFEANVNRDKIVYKQLSESNIRVLVVWECAIRRMKKDSSVAEEIAQEIETFLHDTAFWMKIPFSETSIEKETK